MWECERPKFALTLFLEIMWWEHSCIQQIRWQQHGPLTLEAICVCVKSSECSVHSKPVNGSVSVRVHHSFPFLPKNLSCAVSLSSYILPFSFSLVTFYLPTQYSITFSLFQTLSSLFFFSLLFLSTAESTQLNLPRETQDCNVFLKHFTTK